MTFNIMEKEIIYLVKENKVDISRIDYLLKNGANANASNGVVEEDYNGSLFSECIYEALTNNINVFDILKCFVSNGVDLDKYGSSIIGDLHATFENNDILGMIKYILDNAKTKLNVDFGIRMFRLESDYLSDDFAYYDEKANIIDTVAFLLEEYKYDNNYNDVYEFSKIIGQTVKDVTVDNTANTSNKNYMMVDIKNKDFNTVIKCEEDTLCIYNSLTCYVNNNYKDLNTGAKDSFIEYLKNSVVGSKIEKIEFEHTFDRLTYRVFKSSRNVKIYFSNNKELFYKKLTPDRMFVRLIDLKDSKILSEYKTVFLEQEENFLDGNYCVLPNKKARYNIGHNCNIDTANTMSFVISSGDEKEKEYISIDDDSLAIMIPYFVKHINGFDQDSEICSFNSESFLNIKKDLEVLIKKLEDVVIDDSEYIECVKNFNYFTIEDYISEEDDEYEYKDFNFPYCREEIITFIKAFIWYFNDYKKFNEIGDNRIVNIYRY